MKAVHTTYRTPNGMGHFEHKDVWHAIEEMKQVVRAEGTGYIRDITIKTPSGKQRTFTAEEILREK